MTVITQAQEQMLVDKANSLTRQARLAAAVFSQYSQEQVDRIVKAMTTCAINNAALLAKMAQAIRRAKENDRLEPVEIDDIHRLLQGPQVGTAAAAQVALLKLKIDTQCAASLHYCLTFLAKFGQKLLVDRSGS
mgnify:CR=1 FL=1